VITLLSSTVHQQVEDIEMGTQHQLLNYILNQQAPGRLTLVDAIHKKIEVYLLLVTVER